MALSINDDLYFDPVSLNLLNDSTCHTCRVRLFLGTGTVRVIYSLIRFMSFFTEKKLFCTPLRVSASKDRANLEIDPKILKLYQNKAYYTSD